MDSRLEKIRHFKGTIMDFESYVNSKIAETKKENQVKESLDFTLEDEPKYSLAHCFGDPTQVICYVTYSLRETNNQDKVEKFRQNAVKGNYHDLIKTAMEYLEICNNSALPSSLNVNGEENTIVKIGEETKIAKPEENK